MYAVYANRSALETHFSTSYTQKYLESTKPLIARQKSSLCILAHV
jgi:quinol monooxygenase YgiN